MGNTKKHGLFIVSYTEKLKIIGGGSYVPSACPLPRPTNLKLTSTIISLSWCISSLTMFQRINS